MLPLKRQTSKYFKIIAALSFSWLLSSHSALAVSCTQKNPTEDSLNACLHENPIVKDINDIVNFLAIGVGVVILASIILGGIQYMTAGGSPEAVARAKQRILNALIALLAFLFIFAFLQWLIPGGLFS